MNFFSRVLLNDRMTPLDFDLFRKIHHICGVTPDYFEIVLMVDADTKVAMDSLTLMINCMHNDQSIMGLCGETRIANKRTSWVTAIQVFEYHISHHLGKAFESMFGGVTCLPGCFCMYRIKGRKGDKWIPLLVNPDIIDDYQSNVVDTLHQKNLLLLGEDRFLTTLMLRNFPSRKMMFVPKAVCRTVVPDDFKTLLSQRRRWINSTVHNLLELVLVRNLCGTFCFSMQFVVALDLLGTAVLPVGLVLTYYLIIATITGLKADSDFTVYIPLILLLMIIFLPATLIFFTSRKIVYIGWMIIYLLALPVWNFILPVYAFWHFDDFSWGATRQVTGEGKDTGHGGGDGVFDYKKVTFKRWEDYERAWRKSILRKKRRLMDRVSGISGGSSTNTMVDPEQTTHLVSHAAPIDNERRGGEVDNENQYPVHHGGNLPVESGYGPTRSFEQEGHFVEPPSRSRPIVWGGIGVAHSGYQSAPTMEDEDSVDELEDNEIDLR